MLWEKTVHEKNIGQKSRDTVPLKLKIYINGDVQERLAESAWQNLVLNQDRLVSNLDLHFALKSVPPTSTVLKTFVHRRAEGIFADP